MTATDEASRERERLVTTLVAAGPDAPTSIAAWTASDIASHVAAQDRFHGYPAFAARSVVRLTRRRLSAVYLDRPRVALLVNGRKKPWNKSLAMLRRDVPAAAVRGRVAPITLWEHFVHHEDVRRRNDLPRAAWPDLDAALDWLLEYDARILGNARRRPSTEGTAIDVGEGVTITGSVPEVVLWLSGRETPDVGVAGPDAVVRALHARVKA